MERAIKRQAVAEWRDLQILSAAALINLAGVHARAAFEERLVDDALREALFNPSEWATGQIDTILRHALKPEIKAFWEGAAEDLALIDPSLSPIGEALKREDALALPDDDEPEPEDEQKALLETDAAKPAESAQPRGLGWISRFGGRVATGATGLATTATAAVNTVSPDRLKLTTRLRSAAGQRVDEAWMGQGAEPAAVLAQMIALIDEAAYSARTGLS
ncbi:MAG: hypothetical protein EON59_09540 [Alphaproteobacteria bacterium]|nr:MAG: hypothetical protein EON59_09540 [Alphaproteobacteria bacterium]